jgi:hypothetical protein
VATRVGDKRHVDALRRQTTIVVPTQSAAFSPDIATPTPA